MKPKKTESLSKKKKKKKEQTLIHNASYYKYFMIIRDVVFIRLALFRALIICKCT